MLLWASPVDAIARRGCAVRTSDRQVSALVGPPAAETYAHVAALAARSRPSQPPHNEASGGLVLMASAALALVVANSALAPTATSPS